MTKGSGRIVRRVSGELGYSELTQDSLEAFSDLFFSVFDLAYEIPTGG
jgi:hypothetical protein